MSRICELTGTGPQSGNNVSHSNRHTRRVFAPNLQQVSFYSDALRRALSVRVTAATVRTVEHNGGIDAFLTKTSALKLTPQAVRLKKQVRAALAAAAPAATPAA